MKLLVLAALSGGSDFANGISILEKRCFMCHGAKTQMANLRLDTRDAALRVIKPGVSAESKLVSMIEGRGKRVMPASRIPTRSTACSRGAWWNAGPLRARHARNWDDRNDLDENLGKTCCITDQPAAALLRDLAPRGLLDSTFVIWGGEFGRTPMTQQQHTDIGHGRDHHPNCFSMWLAGGGVRAGAVIGKTDEFGLEAVEDRIHVHDPRAAIPHCLGLDHERLTYCHLGRNFRLTDVEGKLVPKLLEA